MRVVLTVCALPAPVNPNTIKYLRQAFSACAQKSVDSCRWRLLGRSLRGFSGTLCVSLDRVYESERVRQAMDIFLYGRRAAGPTCGQAGTRRRVRDPIMKDHGAMMTRCQRMSEPSVPPSHSDDDGISRPRYTPPTSFHRHTVFHHCMTRISQSPSSRIANCN